MPRLSNPRKVRKVVIAKRIQRRDDKYLYYGVLEHKRDIRGKRKSEPGKDMS